MADFAHAINLIRKYEGFNEKAYADPTTGAEPYTIGFGTQYYPDGSPVKKGQLCSREKALEYLFHEVNIIDIELRKLNLGLDNYMRQALISFVHSVGWEPFLYSEIVDAIEQEDFKTASDSMSRWIFDEYDRVIGNLIDRRREEVNLFLQEIAPNPWSSAEILLTAFRGYTAASHQVRAIRMLEKRINPYVLSEFANSFCITEDPWARVSSEDYEEVFDN